MSSGSTDEWQQTDEIRQQRCYMGEVRSSKNVAELFTRLLDGSSAPEEKTSRATAEVANASKPVKGIFSIFVPWWQRTSQVDLKGGKSRENKKKFKPQRCPHCEHKHEYTSRQGLSWHWKNACESVFASKMAPLQRGREAIRQMFFNGGYALISGSFRSKRKRQPGTLGGAGSEWAGLWGLSGILGKFLGERSQGDPISPGELKPRQATAGADAGLVGTRSSPRLADLAEQRRRQRWDAAVRDHGDGQEMAKAAKEGITRSIFEYVMGSGTGKLSKLGGPFQRKRGHGFIVDVDATAREPNLEEAQSAFLARVKKDLDDRKFDKWQSLVQKPPLPYLRPRRGKLPPGACGSAYTVQPVLLWDPIRLFEFTGVRCRCHHCGSTKLIHKGWTAGKTIEDVNGPFRFYAKRMSCKDCKKASQSDDDGFIDIFPSFVRGVFETQCGTHTYKRGSVRHSARY